MGALDHLINRRHGSIRLHHVGGSFVVIDAIYVYEHSLGKGYGGSLLKEACKWLDERWLMARVPTIDGRISSVPSHLTVKVNGEPYPLAAAAFVEWLMRYGFEPCDSGMVRSPGTRWTGDPRMSIQLQEREAEKKAGYSKPADPHLYPF